MHTAYDAVVIGAGHNGLTTALYLQRAGLKTLVVDEADRVGGMARTEAAPAPDFRHNPHANYLAYGAISPVEHDFDLAAAGLATLTPEAQHGLAFADGRPPLILHRRDLEARTVDNLRAHSGPDAEAFKNIIAAVNGLDPLLQTCLYSPPNRERAMHLVEAASRLAGAAIGVRSARAVIDDLFGSDAVRTLFYQLAAETGLMLEAEGSGVGFLTFTLWLVGQWRLPIGGMQAFADALGRAADREGVEVATGARVERIIVRGGRAAGVVVAGHGQVVARRAIASSAGLVQTLLGFLPGTALSPAARGAVDAYATQEGPSLGGLAIALRAAPDYRSARWNDEINRCFRTVVGYESATATLDHLRAVNAGLLPKAAAAVRVNSLWDKSQAPPGFHIAGGDVLMPGPATLDPKTWEAVVESFVPAFVAVWAGYAPNISEASVIASAFSPPPPYDRAILLREGTDQYRTEIKGLYLCGASTHPGGGVHGACGYNAFQAIAEDLELPSPVPV